MKRITITVFSVMALAMLITSTAFAQQSRFGIKGGFNLSNMYTNNVHDENTKIGFHAGLFYKAAISDFFAIQPELQVTMKGAQLTFANDLVSGTGNFSLNYFEVPVLAVFNISKNFNIHAGAYVASLLDVTIDNEGRVSTFDFEKELDRDNFETLDYGLVGGLGFDINQLSMGLRYEYGLNTVGKSMDFDGTSRTFPDGKNSNLQLYLGISFF